jgi:hypothetical protein
MHSTTDYAWPMPNPIPQLFYFVTPLLSLDCGTEWLFAIKHYRLTIGGFRALGGGFQPDVRTIRGPASQSDSALLALSNLF